MASSLGSSFGLQQSTTPAHSLAMSDEERQAHQMTAKRARIDDGGEPAYAHVTTGDTLGVPPAPASSVQAATSSPVAPAPLALPLTPILTQHAPGWISEVPEFVEAIQLHEPTIPDEVVQYLLERSGCNCTDPKLIRLVSIATQHFLDDVMRDARQYQKLRSKDKEKDKSAVSSELTLADLSSSLQAHGIDLSKPEYYADTVFAGGMVSVGAATAPVQHNLTHGKETHAKDQTKKDGKKK